MKILFKTLVTLSLSLILPFLLPGCGVGPPDAESAESAASGRALPNVIAARVIGLETILVEFAEPAGEAADQPSMYLVRGDDAKAISVDSVGFDSTRMQAMLATTGLVEGAPYTLAMADSTNGPITTVDLATSPRVVGAISTSNTTVVVTFTNNMKMGALLPISYSIVQETSSPEAGVLQVLSVSFLLPQKNAVELTTLAQNEVAYSVHVVNVLDVFKVPIAPPQLLVDPSRASFRGTPTTCSYVCSDGNGDCPGQSDAECSNGATCVCDTLDTDGDGLPDHIEQRGWPVNIELTNRDGVFDRRPPETRDVTSDPLVADTDGDGLNDQVERQLATDPRNPDTDGDGLSDEREFNLFFSNPIDQDSDEDQLDDFLEVSFYKTSPILADTDGDGLNDDVEIFELGRDPRLADLPEWEIDVSNLLLQIDERYTYVDETGETVTEVSSTSSSFAEEDETSKVKFNSKILREGWELGGKLTISAKPSFEIEGKGFRNSDVSSGSDTTTTQSMQKAYESSLDKGREFTTTREVSREVFGASIDASLTVRSTGDIAFSITNLELSVLQLGPDRTSFLPVATLVPNAELLTGETTTLNLGPLLDERGPINLGTQEVFPSLVENLLRSPRGPIIVPANFDITDEFGRNFAFTSQETNDRTATLIIDLGDGTVEEYNVAIAGSIDDKNLIEGVEFVGGFDAEGQPNGIPLDYALQDIIDLTKQNDATPPDSITAGPDGIAQTVAAGDDIQIFNTAIEGLSDITVIIDAGDNGVLDTVILNGDDEFAVTKGYATSPTCNEFTVQRIVEPADGEGDGMVNSVPDGDDEYAPGVTGVGDPVADGADIILAGLNGIIDTVPGGDDVQRGPGDLCDADSDCPGRFSSTVCQGGPLDGLACDVDMDCDLPTPTCFVQPDICSNTSQPCTIDGECTDLCFLDGFCDNGGGPCITNDDCLGTCDPQPSICDENSIYANEVCTDDSDCLPAIPAICTTGQCNGREVLKRYKSAATGQRNRAWIVYSDAEIAFGTNFGDIVLRPRMNVFLGFEQDIDRDGLFARHEFGFGSSDRSKDSDDDGLSDVAEVREGWLVEVVGHTAYRAFPDPRISDSDGDGLSDAREMECGTDPRKSDTDGDGLKDSIEVATNLNSTGTGCLVAPVLQNNGLFSYLDPRNPDTDGDLLLDGIEEALGSNNQDPYDAGRFLDSDEDGLANIVENVSGGWDVSVTYCNNLCASAFDGDCQQGGQCENDGDACLFNADCTEAIAAECVQHPDLGDCVSFGVICETDADCITYSTCEPSVTNVDTCGGVNSIAPGVVLCQSDADCTSECNVVSDICIYSAFDATPCVEDSECVSLPPTLYACIPTICDAGTDCADCGPLESTVTEYSDPTLGDTDFDGLPDFLEMSIGTNPNNIDTDLDGLLDFDEFSSFGQFFQGNLLYEGFFLTDAGSMQLGTDPTSQDTDGDGLSDTFELLDGWRVFGLVNNQARDVYSSPNLADTDLDGLDDAAEYVGKDGIPPGSAGDSGDATDPANPDTDGDGKLDGDETQSDPLVPDLRVRITPTAFGMNAGSGANEWQIDIIAEIVDNESAEVSAVLASAEDLVGCDLATFDDCFTGVYLVDMFSDTFDFEDLSECTGVLTMTMKAGETLLIRTTIGNYNCQNDVFACKTKSIMAFPFEDLSTTSWQEVVLETAADGAQGFDGCTGQFRFELELR